MYVHLDNYVPAPTGGAALHARQRMAVSRCRLLHAAATVGVAPNAVMSRATHELRWRLSLTESAVEPHGNRWMISPSYHAQETTEKTFTSFFMGMVMATLIGEHAYHVSFLTHLKTVLELLGMPPNTGKRPDFIAYRAGRGHYISGTWEAKGTEGKLALSTLVTAKQQAMQPIGISGARGNIRVGSSSSFEKGEWVGSYLDPEDIEQPEIDIPAGLAAAVHYAPLISLALSPEAQTDGEAIVIRMYENVRISVPKWVVRGSEDLPEMMLGEESQDDPRTHQAILGHGANLIEKLIVFQEEGRQGDAELSGISVFTGRDGISVEIDE